MQTPDYKFVIIGAGISGLAAARILAQNNQSFLLLQADNRIGGRICTLTIGEALASDRTEVHFPWLTPAIKDLPIQCGATWLSQDQPVMNNIVQKFGLTPFPHCYSGNKVLALTPSHYLRLPELSQYYNQHLPKIHKLLHSLHILELRFQQLAKFRKGGTITPEESAQFDALFNTYDTMSAYDFIVKEVEDDELADLIANELSILECIKAQDCSVLTLMSNEADCLANLKYYIGAQNSTIDGFRLKEGMSQVVQRLKLSVEQALALQNAKISIDDVIRMGTPVAEVRNNLSPVEIVTTSGEVITCETVLTALPIATLGRIKFGSISPGKQLILNNQLPNAMARQAMVFKQPFWRKLGYNGYVSFSKQFPMNQMVDLTPSDAQCGILGFVFTADGFERWKAQAAADCVGLGGEELRLKEYEVIKSKSLKILAELFLGGDLKHAFLRQVAIFTRTFSNNPYIKAAYSASTAPGIYKQVHELGEDCQDARSSDEKNVVILGSDFSGQFCGYMEGGVRIANYKVNKLLGLPWEAEA